MKVLTLEKILIVNWKEKGNIHDFSGKTFKQIEKENSLKSDLKNISVSHKINIFFSLYIEYKLEAITFLFLRIKAHKMNFAIWTNLRIL